MAPRGREHAESGKRVLARNVQRNRCRERFGDLQTPDRETKRGVDLPLAHPLRDDDEDVREPRRLPFLRPVGCEPQVALELPREGADGLGPAVVLEIELARPGWMQIPP